MKTLVLLRHAKSSHYIEELADIDRPLNDRGYKDAVMMSEILKGENFKISKIITSPAVRAITTALIFASRLKVKYANIVIDERIYGMGREKIFNLVKNLDDKVSEIMIVGHNPDLQETLNLLVKTKAEKFPTTGIAIIEFQVNGWADVKSGKGKLIKLLLPEQFRGERNQKDDNY